MCRLFVLFSLTVLLCFFSNHCDAHNIRSPCQSINVCHHTERDNHVKGNYLSVKILSDQEEKDNLGQIGVQKGASNEQQSDADVDANNEVEEAIKNAQEKVKTAEATINGILQNAEAFKNVVSDAEKKEVKGIEEVKAEADNVDSSITDVSKFVTVITQSQEKAKEKIEEAKEKAESAVTKANAARTKLENAKEELQKAKEIADERQKDQKKQKASDAGRKAENAVADAKSAETENAQFTAALSEVKQAHKGAQLALYKIKAVVEASKVDKAYESLKNNEKSIEKVKAEADAIIQRMTNVLHSFFVPLKQKGKRQYRIAKGLHKLVQKEVGLVKPSELRVKWRKTRAREDAEGVKTKTSIDEAKKEYTKVEESLSSATTEEKNTLNALTKAQMELKKLQKKKLSFDTILNADNVYLAVFLSKEYEEKAKEEEQSATANIHEMETISTDDMTEESKKIIADQLGNAKNILKTFGSDMEAIIKAKNDAESYKKEANEVAEEAENASDDVAAERAMNKSHDVSLLALSEVVNAQNHFNKVVEKAQTIEKLKYAAKTIALKHEVRKIISVTREYVKEATEKQIAAEISVKAIEVLLTNQVTDVKQKVTQQLNPANQALQHLKSEINKLNSASSNAERQIEAVNTSVSTTKKAVSATDAKREAQKAINAASTAEKELKKAKAALGGVKIDAAIIERAKHTANVIIYSNKMDHLYNEIKKDYDGVIEKKRALDTIVTAVQEIFNECPKEAQDEMKSYLQTSKAAQAATKSEANNAQQAEEKTKQLKEEALTALTNVMKAETPLTEIQRMTAKVADSIKVAQEKAQSAHNAMIKAKTEFDKTEKVQYVASVFLSSVKTGQAVRNANGYKKSVTDKKKEAKSAIRIIEDLHQSVSIGFSFIIVNHLNIAEDLFETLSEQEINAINAANKAKTAKDDVDRFLAEVKNSNTSLNDAKTIAEKAKASEIRAVSEEGKAKDVLASVTSDLEKITKAKQDAENVNSKSQQGSSKPVSSVTSKKKPLQKETSAKSSVNERENETQEKNTKHTEVKIPEIQLSNNSKKTTKMETKESEEHNKKMNYNILFSDENNSNTAKTDETEHNENKTVESPSNGAMNPSYTIFVSLNILFWVSHNF